MVCPDQTRFASDLVGTGQTIRFWALVFVPLGVSGAGVVVPRSRWRCGDPPGQGSGRQLHIHGPATDPACLARNHS